MPKSLGQQCSNAIRDLITANPTQVFSELDVVAKIVRKSWSTKQVKNAMLAANQTCGQFYRARKLCRYGPVSLPDETKDYARVAAKIVYADATGGPGHLETPNGDFPRLMIEDDTLVAQGRRFHTNRDDLIDWDDQSLGSKGMVERLEGDLHIASQRAQRAETELREQRSNGSADVASSLRDLQERVAKLEERALISSSN